MELKINNVIIPINTGTQFQLVRRSPLFATSESKIPGSYIFNTNLPGSEQLKQVFGQAHRPQRGGRATAELPAVITDGSMRLSGTVTLVEADRDTYDASFMIDNGDLAVKLKDKTLKDLDLGNDIPCIEGNYSMVTNNTPFEYSEIQDIAAFNYSKLLVYDSVIVDTADGFSYNAGLYSSIYTSPDTDTFEFSAMIYLMRGYGKYSLKLLKNGILFKTYSLVTGSNDLYDELSLIEGDVIQFQLYAESGVTGDFKHQVLFTLKGFILSIVKSGFIFNDAAQGDQDTFDFTVFPIYNPKLLENFPDDAFQIDNLSIKTIYTEYVKVLNYFKDGEFPIRISGELNGELVICANLFTPFVYMRKLLDQIISEAGYSIVNNPFETTEFKNMVLFNAYAENTYTSEITTLSPVKLSFNLIDHVPAILQSDFINYITWLTGYVPVVDNNLLTITFVDLKDRHVISAQNPASPFPGKILKNPLVTVKPEFGGIKFELKKASVDSYLSGAIKDLHDKLIYKGSVASINQLPDAGNMVNDMYLVTNLNEYYVFQYNPETYTLTWRFYSKKFPVIYTEGTEPYLELSTELCPVLTTRIEDETLGAPANRIWTVPRCDQAGILEGFPDSLGAESGLQVLYYKGLSLDSLGEPYPLGTCRYDDYTGDPLLFPDISASSLFDTRYKSWLQWIAYQAKPVTFKAILTAGELSRIKFEQIYSAYGYNFLIKEIRVSLQNDGLSVAEVDIYTV